MTLQMKLQDRQAKNRSCQLSTQLHGSLIDPYLKDPCYRAIINQMQAGAA